MRTVIRTDSRRVGLARALSKLGYCSRTQAAILVRAGRVRLNRAVRRDPEAPVHLDRDQIQVDGKDVESAARVYLMLNTPRGVVTPPMTSWAARPCTTAGPHPARRAGWTTRQSQRGPAATDQ